MAFGYKFIRISFAFFNLSIFEDINKTLYPLLINCLEYDKPIPDEPPVIMHQPSPYLF